MVEESTNTGILYPDGLLSSRCPHEESLCIFGCLNATSEDYDQTVQMCRLKKSLRWAHISEDTFLSHCASYGNTRNSKG